MLIFLLKIFRFFFESFKNIFRCEKKYFLNIFFDLRFTRSSRARHGGPEGNSRRMFLCFLKLRKKRDIWKVWCRYESGTRLVYSKTLQKKLYTFWERLTEKITSEISIHYQDAGSSIVHRKCPFGATTLSFFKRQDIPSLETSNFGIRNSFHFLCKLLEIEHSRKNHF